MENCVSKMMCANFQLTSHYISQLVRPLDQYALLVSTPPENFVTFIVRGRTNRGSTKTK